MSMNPVACALRIWHWEYKALCSRFRSDGRLIAIRFAHKSGMLFFRVFLGWVAERVFLADIAVVALHF